MVRRLGTSTSDGRSIVRSRAGQAAVELVVLLPLIALAAGALCQIVLAGHAAWAAAGAQAA
jgi:hypothetical protein